MRFDADEYFFEQNKGQQQQGNRGHQYPVGQARGNALLEVMAQIEAQGYGACGQHLVVFDQAVFSSGDGADDYGLHALFEQMRDFVRDGLARRAAVHVEAVRQQQPDLLVKLFVAIVHAGVSNVRKRCLSNIFARALYRHFGCHSGTVRYKPRPDYSLRLNEP